MKDAGAHIDSDNSFKVKDYLGKYYKIKTETEFKDTYDYGRQEYPKIITYNIIEILENIFDSNSLCSIKFSLKSNIWKKQCSMKHKKGKNGKYFILLRKILN